MCREADMFQGQVDGEGYFIHPNLRRNDLTLVSRFFELNSLSGIIFYLCVSLIDQLFIIIHPKIPILFRLFN